MKRNFILIMLLMAVTGVRAQTYQQLDFELNSTVPEANTVVYEAFTSIKMTDGFRCNPDNDQSVKLCINKLLVIPPNEGILGGPPSSAGDGVVGALPGKLDVSDIGAAIYSIPIMTPNGIGDMTPNIAITYNNQAGNGLLGWGWSISGLSSIERVGQTYYHDGQRSSVNFVEDRFAKDGNRLMLCSGSYGGNGSVYKTEIDEMSKIIAYTDGYSGPARFVVYKKDGTIWEYGCTDDSRIEIQKHNNVALKWLVNKIYDRDGNAILFHYVENQSTGEYYIESIDYTLNDKANITSMYRMSFCYSDRLDNEFGYVYSNMVQDKKLLTNVIIKNMTNGTFLYDYSFEYLEPGNSFDDYKSMYYRLVSVGLTANGMKLNPTRICWNKHSHYPERFLSYSLSKNMFNKVPFVGDFNGDGFSDVITVPYKVGNTYQANVQASVFLNKGDGSFDENALYTFSFDKTLEWVYVVDFDGDGLDDIVPYYANNNANSSWKSKICIYLNKGNTFLYLGEYSRELYFTVYPGDYFGDNKAGFFINHHNQDHVAYYPHILYYHNGLIDQSLGSQAYTYMPDRIIVEDFNGDGCSEIMYLLANSAVVAKLRFNSNHYDFFHLFEDNNLDSGDYLFPGDFNGDGYTDLLKYDNQTYWKIVYSDGHKLQTPISCLDNTLLKGLTLVPQDLYTCSLENLANPSVTIRTADFDGDGKTDVGVFKSTGGNYYMEVGLKVYKKNANSCDFGDINRYYFNMNYAHQYVYIGNFLGHENASILGSVRSNPYNSEIPKIVSLNPHSSKFVVERITDGLGNAQGFSYKYLTPDNEFYKLNYQCFNSDARTISIPIRALFADTVFTTNSIPCVTKRSYENALYHAKGHGVLGFVRSESKVLINNAVLESKCIINEIETCGNNFITLPSTCSVFNYNDQKRSQEQYTYAKYTCSYNDKIIMPLLRIKKTIEYAPEMPGAVLKSNIENIDYQSDMSENVYADIVNIGTAYSGIDENYVGDDATLCNYRKEVDYTYDNNTSQWIVSRVKNKKIKNFYEDNDAVGNCEIYDFGGSNPYRISRKTILPNVTMNYADPLKIMADYSYDAAGHVITQSLTTPSSKSQRIKRMTYGADYNYRFPTKQINENGWEMDYSYDENYGNIVSTLDYNQYETEGVSDPFNITSENMMPGGVKTVKAKRWADGNQNSPSGAMYYIWEKTSGNAETMSFFSKNGKKLRDVTFGINDEPVYVDFSYDNYGNIASKSMPYKAGEDAAYFYYVYDKNNRLIQEIFPNGLVKYYSFNKLQKTINSISSDGESRNVMESTNALGWPIQTVDIGGNAINYDYYSDGKLKSTIIGDNVLTKIDYEYDGMRNLLRMNDPARGEESYEYNAFGELIQSVNANNGTITYQYDNIGNIIRRTEAEDNGFNPIVTQWVYNNQKGKIGTVSKIIYGDIQEVNYEYDDLLRIVKEEETINGKVYSTHYTYDKVNRKDVVTYPSGVKVKNQYSNTGFCTSKVNPNDTTVFWQINDINAMGYVADYQLGNGLETHREYDNNSYLLSEIFTRKDNRIYQNLSYSYDGYGNLRSRSDNLNSPKRERFVYDDFNRLVEIKMNNRITGTMEYDNYGNIIAKVIDTQSVFYDAHYDGYCPYAVSDVKTDMNDLALFNQSIDYTVFDKMSRIVHGSNSLLIDYGYDHERIHSVLNTNGRKKEKVYTSDCEYVNEDGKDVIFTFIKGPMGVSAVVRTVEKGDNSVFYVHKDNLDSWCLITDEDGEIVQNTSYDAWGNCRGELLFDRGFTGHEHYPELGVINMNGRAYDPMLSMMMSPDSYIQNPDFSQNYNRYSYCYNNPLSYYDPSGEWVEWLLCGVFNGTMNVVSNIKYIDSFGEGALLFGAGFISGCLYQGLSECSWAVQIVGNVSSSIVKTGVNSFVKQNTGPGLDWSILKENDFKNNIMYALGSSLATSVLSSYIVKPTEKDEGISLSGLLCKNKYDQKLFETTMGKITGNLFSGKKMFDGFEITKTNWNNYVPYFTCIVGMFSNGIEFEGKSETLGNVFDKILNFDFQSLMSKFGGEMNYGYSQIRSLFLKKKGN